MATRKSTELIVVHVSATPPSWDHGAQAIDQMHRARGWSGIGYHFVIRRDGTIENGRGIDQIGAHVAGFNSNSIGICLVGGVDERGKPAFNATPEQMATLERLCRELVKKYPSAKICGHRDLSPDRDKDGIIEPHEHLKACPCFDAIPWAASKGLPAADIRGSWTIAKKIEGPDSRNAYLQHLLKRAGYEFGPVDGIVGPKTKAAIERFQMAAGFKKTGMFDEPTVRRLREMFEADRPDPVVVEKKTVPAAVEGEVKRKTTMAGWFTGVATGAGAGISSLLDADWTTVLAIGGLGITVIAGGVLMRKQIIAAVRDIRDAVEGT